IVERRAELLDVARIGVHQHDQEASHRHALALFCFVGVPITNSSVPISSARSLTASAISSARNSLATLAPSQILFNSATIAARTSSIGGTRSRQSARLATGAPGFVVSGLAFSRLIISS